MLENQFQAALIKDIEKLFPGCIVLKNDANYLQGFPDLTILWNEHWAVLELKKSIKEPHQPNQAYYVSYCNDMSFSRTVYPENREAVLSELQQAFIPRRKARVSGSK